MVRPHRKARIASRIWTFVITALMLAMSPHLVVQAENTNSDLVKYWQPVQSYLNKYGYLMSSPDGADNLRTEDKLRDAIRNMQKYGGISATGIIDAPTLKILERKRCGMPDLSPSDRVRRYAIQGQSWSKNDLTWSVKQFPPNMDSGHVRSELSKAFKIWSDVSQLNFREVRSSTADIVISFERGRHDDGYPFDGPGVVLAHAFFPGDGIGGDAHFDAEEPWVGERPQSGVDGVRLFAVAAHEFGHSLGLSHSSSKGALMNPFYQTIDKDYKLPHDDVLGIQRIYGPRNPTRYASFAPYIPPSTTSRPVVTSTRRQPTGGRGSYATTRATRPPIHRDPKIPSTCNTSLDAISMIRNELFIFKGKYFWRFDRNKTLMGEGYPAEIHRLWNYEELQHIDAVYVRPLDEKIVFFSGAKYWLFDGVTKVPGYPRPLTNIGLPPDLKKIDAAMVWNHNGKVYLFSGTQYWRYDESESRVELDYPRDMSLWRGVPYHIDAAFQFTDGKTYFFKGRKYWEFQDNFMRVKKNKSNNINENWFGCPSHHKQAPDTAESDPDIVDSNQDFISSLSEHSHVVSDLFLFVSFITVFLVHRTMYILYL